MLKAIASYCCRDLPLWLIGLLTAWLPENILTCRLRGVLSKPFFKSCGARFQYGSRVRFINPGNMEIGDSVYIAQDGWINAKGGLVLEDGVTIGPRCGLVTTFHRFTDGKVQYGIGTGGSAPIRIGKGTWIAMGVVIVHGLTIGKGCIIAANAVVVKDSPDNVLLGGVPAKVIKSLDTGNAKPQPQPKT